MNGFVDQVKSMGEEKVGQLAAKLLSNQRFVQGVQTIVSHSLEAKETVDRNVQMVFGALGLPTTTDYRELVERVESLERDLEETRDRVSALADELAKRSSSSSSKKKTGKKKTQKKSTSKG